MAGRRNFRISGLALALVVAVCVGLYLAAKSPPRIPEPQEDRPPSPAPRSIPDTSSESARQAVGTETGDGVSLRVRCVLGEGRLPMPFCNVRLLSGALPTAISATTDPMGLVDVPSFARTSDLLVDVKVEIEVIAYKPQP